MGGEDLEEKGEEGRNLEDCTQTAGVQGQLTAITKIRLTVI